MRVRRGDRRRQQPRLAKPFERGGVALAVERVNAREARLVARARDEPCFAGVHALNGKGDATALEWFREAGLLTTPIASTNTHSAGIVRYAPVAAARAQGLSLIHISEPPILRPSSSSVFSCKQKTIDTTG
ncbi:P1 family peptidase, partial [Burkholderia pseudomallei]|uniref:P1 family peptidase n=1 Tax=Burkholderia pseudomallei TaxID=28450 RepID=UPI0027E4F6D4